MPLDTRSESKSVAATDPSPDRRGRRGPRLAALAIAATAVGGAIYGGILSRVDAEKSLARTTSEAAVPSVTIIHPTAGAPQNEIALPGYTQAFTDTPIYARTSGYLKAWHFDIGAHVRKGDLLAEIDTPEVDHQLDPSQGRSRQRHRQRESRRYHCCAICDVGERPMVAAAGGGRQDLCRGRDEGDGGRGHCQREATRAAAIL